MKITGKGIFRKYNRIQNSSRWIQRKIGAIVDPKQKRHAHVGSPELYKRIRDFQIKFLKEMGLMPEDYLLDLGCGTLRGGIPIIRYLEKGHYYGIEILPDVLEEGKKELLASKLTDKEPVLLSGSISSVNIDRELNYVWAFSFLIHLTNEILEDCFEFVSRHLGKQGKFYATVNIGNKKDDSWRGFPVVWRSLDFYKQVASSHGLTVQDIGPRQEFGYALVLPIEDDQRILKICKK